MASSSLVISFMLHLNHGSDHFSLSACSHPSKWPPCFHLWNWFSTSYNLIVKTSRQSINITRHSFFFRKRNLKRISKSHVLVELTFLTHYLVFDDVKSWLKSIFQTWNLITASDLPNPAFHHPLLDWKKRKVEKYKQVL